MQYRETKYLAADVEAAIVEMADAHKRLQLMRFFKTAPGEYGHGDLFLGVTAPQVRSVVKEAKRQVDTDQIHLLLMSPYHEVRLCGFLLTVELMLAARPRRTGDNAARAVERRRLVEFYLAHARQANNWDLVDMSCPKILGTYLVYPDENGTLPSTDILLQLAASTNLWEQRIAMVTNWMLVRHDIFQPLITVADRLLSHPHDLIHKAVGWMLREMGKRQEQLLHDYLLTRLPRMHRTTLRYAIELLPITDRQYYLHLPTKPSEAR